MAKFWYANLFKYTQGERRIVSQFVDRVIVEAASQAEAQLALDMAKLPENHFLLAVNDKSFDTAEQAEAAKLACTQVA